jgi:hypothetical protein
VPSFNAPELFARKYLWIVACPACEFVGIVTGSAGLAIEPLTGIVVAGLPTDSEVKLRIAI